MNYTNKQVVAVVGGNKGDEGKGGVVEDLCGGVVMVCRGTGGANAGHTIFVGGEKHKFNLIPCGILNPEAVCVLGNGMVIDLDHLFKEIVTLESSTYAKARMGFADGVRARIKISSRAHIVLRVHKELDRASEQYRESLQQGDVAGVQLHETGAIGSTLRGISPAYASKANRTGVRVGDLVYDWLNFVQLYQSEVTTESHRYDFSGRKIEIDSKDELGSLYSMRKYLIDNHMVVDTAMVVNAWIDSGKRVVLEGANAAMIDMDHGNYPFCTASNATVGGLCTGLGVPPEAIEVVYNVVKAYCTAVGRGNLPTKITGELAGKIQQKGNEYGTTTSRLRDVGWFDIPMTNYALMINGRKNSRIVLTKLDVLGGMGDIKVCTEYLIAGQSIKYIPATSSEYSTVEPRYGVLPGWTEDISKARRWEDLPDNVTNYVEFIDNALRGSKLHIVEYIRVSAEHGAMIKTPWVVY